ncbi:hypothetical protein V1508DRAFT_431593 [Lipomyces doorenjongii]|uniref:uncharacterized protein n=1 Tax=Lipomyces doorenjongii TaxID=383834 RepID=UPI0034CD9FDD
MSAAEYHNQKSSYDNYGPPPGPPPGQGPSDRGFANNSYPQQPQQAYGGQYYQGGGYPQQGSPYMGQGQGGYYPPPQQQGGYYPPQQQGGYPPQGGPVYVQQPQRKDDNMDCLMGCCAALCVCCALDALC